MTTQTTTTPTPESTLLLRRMVEALEAINGKMDMQAELIKRQGDALNALTTEMLFLKQHPAAEAATATAAAPVAGRGNESTTQFVAQTISYGVTDGKPVYKAKGGQFMKFGVTIWPEVLPMLGLDATKLQFGENQFGKPVVAILKEGKAQKVIGLG